MLSFLIAIFGDNRQQPNRVHTCLVFLSGSRIIRPSFTHAFTQRRCTVLLIDRQTMSLALKVLVTRKKYQPIGHIMAGSRIKQLEEVGCRRGRCLSGRSRAFQFNVMERIYTTGSFRLDGTADSVGDTISIRFEP